MPLISGKLLRINKISCSSTTFASRRISLESLKISKAALRMKKTTTNETAASIQIGKPKLIVDDRKDYIEKLIKEITK